MPAKTSMPEELQQFLRNTRENNRIAAVAIYEYLLYHPEAVQDILNLLDD